MRLNQKQIIMYINEFKKELNVLLEKFNKGNDCAITELQLNPTILSQSNGKKDALYDIFIKIE